jgi:hypothetical protein
MCRHHNWCATGRRAEPCGCVRRNAARNEPERLPFVRLPGGGWAGVPGEDMLVYLGFGRPRFRRLFLPPDQEFTVDVIDTWAMTTERLPGTVRGLCTVPLPGRQWLALRITRA